jgi:MFS family permease
VAKRPDLVIIFTMIFLVGTFGVNFPIFASTMAVHFGQGAGEFGVLSSALAIGAVVGALLAARTESPRKSLLLVSTMMFGVGCAIAAVMPTYWAFALVLPLVGISAQTFMTTANSTVQLSTEPEVRGRVMAIYMAIFMGGTPIGAPIVGWVANEFGARWALGVGAASGFAAAIAGVIYLVKYRGLRLQRRAWRLGFTLDDREELRTELAVDEAAATR